MWRFPHLSDFRHLARAGHLFKAERLKRMFHLSHPLRWETISHLRHLSHLLRMQHLVRPAPPLAARPAQVGVDRCGVGVRPVLSDPCVVCEFACAAEGAPVADESWRGSA